MRTTENVVLYFSRDQLVWKAEQALKSLRRCKKNSQKMMYLLLYGSSGPRYTERKKAGEPPSFHDAIIVYSGHFNPEKVVLEAINPLYILVQGTIREAV